MQNILFIARSLYDTEKNSLLLVWGKRKPLLVIECIKSWQKYCPDYEIMEWNSKNYDVHKNKYMEQAYQAKRWGFVFDYARLDIIYQYGGIYLDTDVELIRSLDDLLETDGYIGFEKKVDEECDEVYVNTGQGLAHLLFIRS